MTFSEQGVDFAAADDLRRFTSLMQAVEASRQTEAAQLQTRLRRLAASATTLGLRTASALLRAVTRVR